MKDNLGFDPFVLIEASAGTGKTQALASRIIDLLRLGVKPCEVVALTFSRAAAGEIFGRFVSLLAESAKTDAKDAELLRETIATQHLSQIGTLDGFLMKIVRCFPLELGLSGELTIMDDYAAAVERGKVSFSVLRRTDEASKRAFASAFAFAMNGEDVRSFVEAYREFIKKWHELYLSMPDESAWGDASAIWDPVPAAIASDENLLAAAAENLRAVQDAAGAKALDELADFTSAFRGSFAAAKGFVKKFLTAPNLFDGATIEISFNRRQYAFGGESAAAIRLAMMAMYGYCVRRSLALARGVHRLMSAFEREYASRVRCAGKLVFSDIPRLISALGEPKRIALEYRMDARIKAWALDEFQDTSREQWGALKGLVDEAKQSGDKSMFIVGDRKQAIYGWRNGDVRIFSRERDCGLYKVLPKNESWRFGGAVTEAVNKVFRGGRIGDEFPLWTCPEHKAVRPEPYGFVQRVDAPGPTMEDFVVPVFNALKAVDPVGRGISAAVLVRGNAFGEFLAARLKAAGLDGVVWEGESAILDTPSLMPFLDLVVLSDHPGDKQAYEHFKTTPLAAAKYPGGVPSAADVSCEFAREFAMRGLVRSFRTLRALLPSDPDEAWSRFTEGRFTDMLRAAADFEMQMRPGARLGDFVRFLSSRKKRNIAEPGRIKIMTIHRSKGLGFDYVVLPLYERLGLKRECDGPLVGDGWVLPDPGSRVVGAMPQLAAAGRERHDREEQEALCGYYVAMTRAKRAMTVVLHPAPAKSDTVRFSDIVRDSMEPEIGDREWFRAYEKQAAEGAGAAKADDASAEWSGLAGKRARRVGVRRRLPSSDLREGMSAGDLFVGAAASGKAALERGLEMHAAMEGVEWIDPAAARNDAERALAKPEGFVELWREKAYECMADGVWESGRFDRVVFVRDGGGLRATVMDYKTNRPRRGEAPGDFRARMASEYAGQMRSYRRAVSSLSGIAPENVSSMLLLLSTGETVAVV